MKTHFYAHIYDPEDIRNQLEVLDINDHEKEHLTIIIQSTLHHAVIDIILEELHDDHKHVFMKHITDENHDDTWSFIEENIDDPETKIRSAIEGVTNELLEDIKAVQEVKLSSE